MPNILTINAGSSSIRFAVFETSGRPTRVLQGKLERIGSPDACLTVRHSGAAPAQISMPAVPGRSAVDLLVEWLRYQYRAWSSE